MEIHQLNHYKIANFASALSHSIVVSRLNFCAFIQFRLFVSNFWQLSKSFYPKLCYDNSGKKREIYSTDKRQVPWHMALSVLQSQRFSTAYKGEF